MAEAKVCLEWIQGKMKLDTMKLGHKETQDVFYKRTQKNGALDRRKKIHKTFYKVLIQRKTK